MITQEQADTRQMSHKLAGHSRDGWAIVQRCGDGYCRVIKASEPINRHAPLALESLLTPTVEISPETAGRLQRIREGLKTGKIKIFESELIYENRP